jgi:DNA-binding transcriptional ArsR family regulator
MRFARPPAIRGFATIHAVASIHDNVNDCRCESIAQDLSDDAHENGALMAEPEPTTGEEKQDWFVEERTITDLETLRLLADPLRLSILGAFPPLARRPMSVKEIAEKIDEGQTKLYRHVKKLEEAGLLRMVETRVVSGIIEKRYLPAQKRMTIEGSMLALGPEPDDFTDTVVALMDSARDRLRTGIRAGRVPLTAPDEGPDLSPQVGSIRVNMTLERYLGLQAKVTELLQSIGPSDESPDAFSVHLQALLYASFEPTEQEPGPSLDSDIAAQAEEFLAAEQSAQEQQQRQARARSTNSDQAKRRHA